MADDVLDNNSDLDILRMDNDAESDGNDETPDGDDEGTFSLDDETSDADSETDDESESESDESGDGKRGSNADDESESDVDEEFTGDEVGDYSPVPKAELLKAYPDIFKKFPQIQNTFNREEKFTELFPTVEDAQTAQDYQEAFHNFENHIASGDPTHLLDSIKKMNPETFGRFTGNFMDTLYKVDREQFNSVLSPITKRLVRHIFAEGIRSKNENLVNSAQHFSDYLFGTEVEKIPQDRKEETRKNPEQEKFEKERQEHEERAYGSSLQEVGSYVDRKLDTYLSNIDPNNKLSAYAKKNLVRDIKEEIGSALRKETPLQRTLGNLWGRGKKVGYSPEIKKRIGDLYISRAKQVAPTIVKRLVKEAIGGGPKPTVKKTSLPSGGKPTANGNKARTVSSKTVDPKLIDFNKSSDADILRGKVTLRGKN